MIHVRGLAKSYGGAKALAGVDFDVERGEIFGFVGPNGAGKTTTLRILAGLLAPDAGRVLLDGCDVVARPADVRAKVGWMPDFFGVYDRLSTAEYLAFYASCHRIPRRRVNQVVSDLLELIGLSHSRDAAVDSLSRGMKQRLCLARALVHDPAVLLLDEPASGLDPTARVEMRELLLELQTMGKTVVLSSHILPELAELCTSFGVIADGRMQACGPLSSLAAGAGGRRVQVRVLGSLEEAATKVAGLPQVCSVQVQRGALVVEHEGDEDQTAALLDTLLTAGVRVSAFAPLASDLEDAFLRLTETGPGL